MNTEAPLQALSFKQLCANVRKIILETSHKSGTSHVGSCLSVVEILVASYISCKGENDKVILSKGHASNALYSTLSTLGMIENFTPDVFSTNNSEYYGHVNHKVSEKIPLSTGSLGHGLPFGIGIGFANKINRIKSKIIVVISDGECNEGTTWESAMIANHFNLNNLIVVIDRNGLQSLDTTENTIKLEPLLDKWKSFGWDTVTIDGHDFVSLNENLEIGESPKCIIANTIKGKGISFMENSIKWHYKFPDFSELQLALSELE